MIIAQSKDKIFLLTAARLPKYLISSGNVAIPIIISAEIKRAICAYPAPSAMSEAARGKAISMFQRNSREMLGGSIVFSSSSKYPCDVIAKEDSMLLWIEKNVVLHIFLKNKIIAENMLTFSANRIMQLEKRLELFSFYSIQKKIAFSLCAKPKFCK